MVNRRILYILIVSMLIISCDLTIKKDIRIRAVTSGMSDIVVDAAYTVSISLDEIGKPGEFLSEDMYDSYVEDAYINLFESYLEGFLQTKIINITTEDIFLNETHDSLIEEFINYLTEKELSKELSLKKLHFRIEEL